jgi:hypothetical protein
VAFDQLLQTSLQPLCSHNGEQQAYLRHFAMCVAILIATPKHTSIPAKHYKIDNVMLDKHDNVGFIACHNVTGT